MSNAEQYIQEHTRNAVNHITEKFPWISVCDAQKAVEIAREETIDKIKRLFEQKYLIKSTEPLRWVSWEKVFSDLKQAMKYEQGRRKSIRGISINITLLECRAR